MFWPYSNKNNCNVFMYDQIYLVQIVNAAIFIVD